MTLSPGTRIGPFEVVELLGAGGMGEVYRARDTSLGREVALKIVPEEYTRDGERLARFEREARVLASLNHPNIATLYGVEQGGGIRALVLELVDGETLSDRISRGGPLSAADTLALARQMAEALDAAHEKGIIHRDLKPANVRVSSDGVVKILDFGIAKAMRGTAHEQADVTTVVGTQHGVLLGTAPYMSPEQVRGQAVDKRADVWAYGCVLYEALTGRSPFAAETVSDTMARIVGAEPDWGALPRSAPAGLVNLIKRCLEKDQKRRLRDLGDSNLALAAATDVPAPPSRSASPWRWGVAGAFATALLFGAALWMRSPQAAPPETVRFEVPPSVTATQSFAVSGDGRRLVFAGRGADGIQRIWQRSLDELETRPLIGTENEVAENTTMWFSPDGRSIGFYAAGAIKKVDSAGGSPQIVCRVPAVAVGGAWSADGVIVVGNVGGGLLRCPADGGDPVPVTMARSGDPTEIHLFPSFLPDGKRLIYLRVWRSNPSAAGLYLADLDRGAEQQPEDRLVGTNLSGEFIAERGGAAGRLLFVRDGTLWAVAFDPAQGAVRGDPVQIASGVGSFRDGALFRGSPTVLAYRGDTQEYQLAWFDRAGKRIGNLGEPGPYLGVALSPDGNYAAVLRENRLNRAESDIWLMDINRDTTTRVTSDPLLESMPTWSADGARLYYVTGHDTGSVWSQPLSGGSRSEVLRSATDLPLRINPLLTTLSTTADGRFLLFSGDSRAGTRGDTWVLPLSGDGAPAVLLGQPFEERHAVVSPDRQRIAFVSNESGVEEVFVASLATTTSGLAIRGGATLVSRGGRSPRWRADSRELFYQSPTGEVMAVPLAAGQIGLAVPLFEAPGTLTHWGVAPDGQRFLMAMPLGQGASTPFTVVLNWQPAADR